MNNLLTPNILSINYIPSDTAKNSSRLDLNSKAPLCCDAMPSRFDSNQLKQYSGMIWIPEGTFTMGGK